MAATGCKSILVIRASPRADGHSNRIVDKLLGVLQKEQPSASIKEWWLHDEDSAIPEFGQAAINGKRQDASASDKAIWSSVLAVIDEFKRADKYVIATPMWNFGIPAKLKNLVDVLLQNGLTFDDEKDKGLLEGKKVLFICARAGAYETGSKSDFQLPYLQKVLSFMGVHDQKVLLVESTWMGDKSDVQPLQEAEMLARTW